VTFELSLDETANQKDVVVEASGIRFLVDEWSQRYVDGLEIDVREHWGRDGVVAFNRDYGGC
jgi:Fe-S cluster assembly iron-binding protein IscA